MKVKGGRFPACPFCGWPAEKGFTGIEFRYDLNEVWLSNGSYVEHRHVGLSMPDPASFRLPDTLTLLTLDTRTPPRKDE